MSSESPSIPGLNVRLSLAPSGEGPGIVVGNRMDKEETNRIIFQDKVGDRAYLNTQDQWGGSLSLQYRPSAEFSLAVDALIGRLRQIDR